MLTEVLAVVVVLTTVGSATTQFNCTCLFTENSNVTVPTGTRLVTVADLFGTLSTYETLCPCSCASNCTCTTQLNPSLAAENVYQPYYTCPSSTSPMASTWTSTAAPPTSVASPNCSVPGSAQMYLPGTYVSGQLAGSSISVAISCPCYCYNNSCTLQTFDYVLPTTYQPYQFCPSSAAPTTTTTNPFPCTFTLPSSNTSFPPGTYYSTPIVAINQSIVISCPCSCNSTICSMQIVSALLPTVFTPYALCSSPSTSTSTTAPSTSSSPFATTSAGPCNCYSASNNSNSLVLPVGTFLSYSLSSFGLNYTVQLSCACSCDCVCTTTYSTNSGTPSVYIPYAACNGSTTSAPSTSSTTSAYPSCSVALPGGNASFPAGTYYTNAVPGMNQSVVISCPCSCDGSFCSLRTVSQTLPTTFIPYLFCSSNVAATTTAAPTTASATSSARTSASTLTSTQSVTTTTKNTSPITSYSTTMSTTQMTTSFASVSTTSPTASLSSTRSSSSTFSSTLSSVATSSTRISSSAAASSAPSASTTPNSSSTLSASVAGTTAEDCACYSAANNSNSLVLPIGTYLLYSLQFAGANYTAELTCDCTCGCICNTTYTGNNWAPAAYIPYATCNNSTTPPPQTLATSATYPNCSVSLPNGNASFPAGTYYSSPVPGFNASVIISCPCSCANSSCTMQTVLQTMPTVFTPYMFCGTGTSTTSPMSRTAATSAPTCVCYTYENGSNSTVPIGTIFQSAFSAFGINYTVTMTCGCSCGCLCNTSYISDVSLPLVYTPYATCGNGSTSTSVPTVSYTTKDTYPNCSFSLAGSNVSFPAGTYYVSSISGLNASAVVSCPCNCTYSMCSLQIVSTSLPSTYTPYAFCPASASTSQATPTPQTASCVAYTDATLSATVPIGTYYSSAMTLPNANFSLQLYCPCQCGAVCNTTVSIGVLPSAYQPNALCTSTSPPYSYPNCTVLLPNSSIGFPPGTNFTSPVVGLNLSVVITCPCSCAALCTITTINSSAPFYNQPYAFCPATAQPVSLSYTTASTSTTSSPSVSTSTASCLCLTAQNSNNYLPIGTLFSSSVTIGLTNYTVVLSCACQCACVCNTTTTPNSYLPTVYQPYANCPASSSLSPSTSTPCYASLPGNGVTFPVGTVMRSNTVLQGATLGFQVTCPCSCGAVCTLQNFTYPISQMYTPGALCINSSATSTSPVQSFVQTTASPTSSSQSDLSSCSCALGYNYSVPIGSYYQSITQTSTTTTVQISGQSVVIPLNFCIQTTWSCPCNCSSCQCTYQVTNLNPLNCPGNITYPIVPYYYCPSTTSVTTPSFTTSAACMSSIYGNSVPPGSTVLISMPCFQISCTCNCSCSSTCTCSFLPTSCPQQAGSYNATSTVIQGQCNSPVGRRKRSVREAVSEAYLSNSKPQLQAELTAEEEAIMAGFNRQTNAILYETDNSNQGYNGIISLNVTQGLHISRPEDMLERSFDLDESARRIAKFYLRAILQQTSLRNRVISIGSIALRRIENQSDSIQVEAKIQLQNGSIDSDHFMQECAKAYELLRNRYTIAIDTASCTIAKFPAL